MVKNQALSSFWGKISKPVGGEGQRSNKNFGEGQFTGHMRPLLRNGAYARKLSKHVNVNV